jgi:hypothetical protein
MTASILLATGAGHEPYYRSLPRQYCLEWMAEPGVGR